MKKIIFSLLIGTAFFTHCNEEFLDTAVRELDVQKVSTYLQQMPQGLTEKKAQDLCKELNDIILTFPPTAWYKRPYAVAKTGCSAALFAFCAWYINESCHEKPIDGGSRLLRSAVSEAFGDSRITKDIFLILSGAGASFGGYHLIDGIARLFTKENPRAIKALAVKCLINDALARNKDCPKKVVGK